MAGESIRVSDLIPALAEEIYEAWLDGERHAAMTGSAASGEPSVGGAFTAWDGYISGTNLVLEPHRRIVQRWRTTEFPAEADDSLLEVILEPAGDATRVTLVHADIPEGQGASYEQGWRDYYFSPMKNYFGLGAAEPIEQERPEGEALETGIHETPKARAASKPAAAKPKRAAAKKPAKAKAKAKPKARAAAKKPAKAKPKARAAAKKPAKAKPKARAGAKKGGAKKGARRSRG